MQPKKNVIMFDLMPFKRRPGKALASFRNEIDDLFNRFFDMDTPVSRRLFGEGEWVPRVDVVEGKGGITVKAEIPGCEIKDIDAQLDRRALIIRGEKKQGFPRLRLQSANDQKCQSCCYGPTKKSKETHTWTANRFIQPAKKQTAD
ncbi:MAG: hypothetical protein R6W95_01635 [Desulfosarcina sp.]